MSRIFIAINSSICRKEVNNMDEYQIIGIDFAKEGCSDMSAINSICGMCKNVIETRVFNNDNNMPQSTLFKKCPVCKTHFKRHIIREEY
jgi:hypothetical protein